MIEVEFVGATNTVTGSKHLVRTPHATILLDCGLFQGHRRESFEKNRHLGIDPREIDAVVLSHAHIDHSGALPVLVKQGFSGSIHATAATRDLCAAMLADAARIQMADARYVNKLIERDLVEMTPVEPLYSEADVVQALDRFVSVPYHHRQNIAPGVDLTLLDAGHVLGSAIVVLDVQDDGETKRVAFSGDLGRPGTAILREPEPPRGAHFLIMESTYGDRLHPPAVETDETFARAIHRARERRGKIIVPSFALERAQEIVLALKRLRSAGRCPNIPVYVDSPLTVKITDVFKLHPECYDDETRALVTGSDSPFEFDGLRYITDKADSQAIDASPGPCIIISASGMCEAGRVLHHLQRSVENPDDMVVIVGFQAQHTLGRRIVERRDRVRIFGVERDLRAEVVVLDGFSAHADRQGLVDFAEAARAGGPLRQVALVHGEPKAQAALAAELEQRGFPSVIVPQARTRARV